MLNQSKQMAIAMGLTVGFVIPTTATVVQAQTPPAPPLLASAAISYRVVVDSDDPNLLARVKQVAPRAFIQSFSDDRDRIQAGAFAGEASARNRVDELANQGIRAVAFDTQGNAIYQALAPGQTTTFGPGRTLPPRGASNSARAVKKMPRGYYAIVPVARDQLGITFEAVRKLGVPEEFMSVGQKLRGWHVSVGVYSKRSDSEKMSQYLRSKGGFDARSYFEP